MSVHTTGIQTSAQVINTPVASGAHLEGDRIGDAVVHAKLAQAEGGAQVGGKQRRAQRNRLIGVQVPILEQRVPSNTVGWRSGMSAACPGAWPASRLFVLPRGSRCHVQSCKVPPEAELLCHAAVLVKSAAAKRGGQCRLQARHPGAAPKQLHRRQVPACVPPYVRHLFALVQQLAAL